MSIENRRRQHYIKRAFQGRFILQFLALMVLGCAAFSLSLYLYSRRTLTTAFLHSKLQVMSTADFLLPALVLIALVVTGAVALLAAVRLLFFSHKIAGPLYRLEKTAEAVAGGKLNFQVRFRSDDELQELAHSMDVMVKDLRARTLVIKRQTERLREILSEADKVSSVPKDLLQALRETQVRLDEAAGHFQV